jgi:hypothetical protein
MLVIKNWEEFQHFKDRDPIWIKVYRKLLDDIKWHELSGDDAKLLVMLWLLASENMGKLPEIKEIAFRFRLPEKSIKSSVSRLSHFLYQDDIKLVHDDSAISGGYQADSPHALAERQRREEKEKETDAPDGVSPSVWQDFKTLRAKLRAPITQTSMAGIVREAEKAGVTLEVALRTCCERGWRGFKADWMVDKGLTVAAVTVPSRMGVDPAIAKAIADARNAVPPSESVRAKLAELRTRA